MSEQNSPTAAVPLRYGVLANWGQILVLSVVTFWVGAVVGVERVVVPALGTTTFHLSSYAVLLSFIASFGVVKAVVNLLAGDAADRIGRRRLLVLGWIVALPVPALLAYGGDWTWIVVANALVGANQGLAWSMAVTSKVDLAGSRQRGFAMGLNEFAGYAGVAVGGVAGAFLGAVEFRAAPAEFLAVLILAGLVSSLLVTRETREHARRESGATSPRPIGAREAPTPGLARAFRNGTWADRRLASLSQAGLVEKFVDTLAWGLLPVFLLLRGLDLAATGIVVGAYTGSWAVLQLVFGPLSDRWGRRGLITGGMVLAGLGALAMDLLPGFGGAIGAALLAGTGMAMLYPTLLAAVADVAPAVERGGALGVYRFWRDGGYAIGGLTLGLAADLLGIGSTFVLSAGLMIASAALFAWGFREVRAGPDASQGGLASFAPGSEGERPSSSPAGTGSASGGPPAGGQRASTTNRIPGLPIPGRR